MNLKPHAPVDPRVKLGTDVSEAEASQPRRSFERLCASCTVIKPVHLLDERGVCEDCR